MSRSRLRFGFFVAAIIGIGLAPAFPASPRSLAWGDESVDDSRLQESSGLAVSQHSAKRFWTHNDSGDSARLFALDAAEVRRGGPHQAGAIQVTAVQVAGAEAVDWEDMASGVLDGRATLVVADTGDNLRSRDRVTLYVIDEPVLRPASGSAAVTVLIRHRIEFRYPDGPRDCEAIAIDAERRRVICISKELLPIAGVYSVPLPAPAGDHGEEGEEGEEGEDVQGRRDVERGAVVIAERLGTLPLPMVSGIDLRSDGRQLAVTGYFDLFLFDREEAESWEVALRRVPKHIPLPKLKQIEAVCFDRQGELWITSEGAPMPLRRISRTSEEVPLREGTR